jgi:hypothetical protein
MGPGKTTAKRLSNTNIILTINENFWVGAPNPLPEDPARPL